MDSSFAIPVEEQVVHMVNVITLEVEVVVRKVFWEVYLVDSVIV